MVFTRTHRDFHGRAVSFREGNKSICGCADLGQAKRWVFLDSADSRLNSSRWTYGQWIYCMFMAGQPTPPRNKGLIAGLIKGNQWLLMETNGLYLYICTCTYWEKVGWVGVWSPKVSGTKNGGILYLIRLFWMWRFPYISLTYSLSRWVPPF